MRDEDGDDPSVDNFITITPPSPFLRIIYPYSSQGQGKGVDWFYRRD
jgi:hypothetical protein